jgi:hypothetical protein
VTHEKEPVIPSDTNDKKNRRRVDASPVDEKINEEEEK